MTWEEPPSTARLEPIPYQDAFEEVMRQPENWAKIMEGDSKRIHVQAAGMRKKAKENRLPGQEEGEWEIKVRKLPTGDGKAGVWVMYRKKKGS